MSYRITLLYMQEVLKSHELALIIIYLWRSIIHRFGWTGIGQDKQSIMRVIS